MILEGRKRHKFLYEPNCVRKAASEKQDQEGGKMAFLCILYLVYF